MPSILSISRGEVLKMKIITNLSPPYSVGIGLGILIATDFMIFSIIFDDVIFVSFLLLFMGSVYFISGLRTHHKNQHFKKQSKRKKKKQ